MTVEQQPFKRVEQESFTMDDAAALAEKEGEKEKEQEGARGSQDEPQTHGSTVTVSHLTWHRFPEKPARHRHWKPSTSS